MERADRQRSALLLCGSRLKKRVSHDTLENKGKAHWQIVRRNLEVHKENSRKFWVIYDGECAFCRRQIERLRRRDRSGRFECLPSQSEALAEHFPELEGADLEQGVRLITPERQIYSGADAVYQITRRLPRWRRIAWLYHVPGIHALCRWGYRWIARHRHRLGCEVCNPTD